MTVSLSAHAESIQLQLPAQSLASSLSDIAQQANIALLFDEALLRNIKAPALSGSYNAQDAIRQLLKDTDFSLIQVDSTYVVRPKEQGTTTSNSLELSALSVVGNGNEVDSSNVGKSTMTQAEINRYQANNIPSLLSTLPGIYLGGSLKPGGQTINIWGLGEAEDVQLTVDGATNNWTSPCLCPSKNLLARVTALPWPRRQRFYVPSSPSISARRWRSISSKWPLPPKGPKPYSCPMAAR